MFRACQFFHKLIGFLAVVFFLQVFFDALALFFNPLLSRTFFNFLVGFCIKFGTISRICHSKYDAAAWRTITYTIMAVWDSTSASLKDGQGHSKHAGFKELCLKNALPENTLFTGIVTLSFWDLLRTWGSWKTHADSRASVQTDVFSHISLSQTVAHTHTYAHERTYTHIHVRARAHTPAHTHAHASMHAHTERAAHLGFIPVCAVGLFQGRVLSVT